MISLEEAQDFVRRSITALSPVESTLDLALGYVAAERVVAKVPVPGFSNSAMDGYALRALDTSAGSARLRVIGSVLAGDALTLSVHENEAMRIMTGAPLPAGADCVCKIEDVVVEPGGQFVQIPRKITLDENVRHPGEDIGVGQVLIEPGDELTPTRLGVLASQGFAWVLVHPRPRVGVLSTGDELAEHDEPLEASKIHDTNRPMLMALLRRSGFTPVDLKTASDDYEHIADKIREGVQSCDAVISTGGVSMGDVDHVKTVLTDLCGANARWMQVAIKPGKPFTFGVTREHTPVFGLAGNPVSTLVGYEMFVRPALRSMAGHRTPERARVLALLDCAIPRHRDEKVHLVHAVASFGDDGRLHIERTSRQGSHLLHAVAGTNALVLVPDGDGLGVGDETLAIIVETE